MTKSVRKTKQKEVIEKYLASTCCHPSADTVYSEVKKELPNISKATVYRILRNFKEKGKIQEIPTDVSRWDYKEDPHPHFICNQCGQIFDIEEKVDIPEKKKLDVGMVESCRMVFCGVCKTCK